MKNIYVITLDGEPIHAYTSEEAVKKACFKYLDDNRDEWVFVKDFDYWCEDRSYLEGNGDYDYDKAWEAYTEEIFENGTWMDIHGGECAWYECPIDEPD